MQLSRFGTALITFGLAIIAAPSVSHAVPLSSLFQGAQLAGGGKVFTDWTLIDLQTTGGGIANFDQINVSPITDNAAYTGLRYFAPDHTFGTPLNHPEAAAVRLTYSFNVRAISGAARIENSSALISGYNFFARAGARIRIIETVKTAAGGTLAEIIPFVRPGFTPDDPNLFQSAAFVPQSTLHVVTRIDIDGPLINDSARLTRFEQRFAPAPEPTGVALAGMLMICATFVRCRRR